jgi:hypothetical protein
MKKITIILITLVVLLCGSAMADSGVDPVPETQGIFTATTIDAVGNAASTTDIQWRITSSDPGLAGQPPLGDAWRGIDPPDADWTDLDKPFLYSSTYSEDTYSNGIGLIAYDKNMDVETSGQLSGQWNIEAEKQIEFVGVDGARVYSDENIMVDGVGNLTSTREQMLCVFVNQGNVPFPAFCNYAEAGSTVDMTAANVRTTSMDRFVVPTSDTSVELEHDILVTELIDGIPSSGTASAYVDVLIQESRSVTQIEYWRDNGETLVYDHTGEVSPLAERIEFSESTSITGDISVFDKQMNYNSKYNGLFGTDVNYEQVIIEVPINP